MSQKAGETFLYPDEQGSQRARTRFYTYTVASFGLYKLLSY